MHDMWLALVAAAFGKIGFVKKATMLYRQHGKNANGAKNVRSLKYFVRKVFGTKEIHAILVMYYTQAAEFYKLYKPQLQEEQREMLKAFSSLEDKNIIRKIFVMKKYHLFKKGIVRKLGQILC